MTPMQYALSMRHEQLINLLVEHKCYTTIPHTDFPSIVVLALLFKHDKLFKLFLSSNPDFDLITVFNKIDFDQLKSICNQSMESHNLLELFIQHSNECDSYLLNSINAKPALESPLVVFENGDSLLHYYVNENRRNMLQHFIERKVSFVATMNKEGLSPLICLSLTPENHDLIELLIDQVHIAPTPPKFTLVNHELNNSIFLNTLLDYCSHSLITYSVKKKEFDLLLRLFDKFPNMIASAITQSCVRMRKTLILADPQYPSSKVSFGFAHEKEKFKSKILKPTRLVRKETSEISESPLWSTQSDDDDDDDDDNDDLVILQISQHILDALFVIFGLIKEKEKWIKVASNIIDSSDHDR